MWRPLNFPTVSRHKALYLKSAMPTSRRDIDVPTAPSPNFRETAHAAVVADF